jgi:arylsulfatase A-like enzyme
MKAIMVMFDSLNRHFLPSYGNDWVKAPNFQRLAEKTVQFEKSYVCSVPCMPARRELHTGRAEFLHRGWGPIEPFDDSAIEMLSRAGVYTHLISDHYHYWEEPCLCNYHTKYTTWEFPRGQEGDPFVGQVADPTPPSNSNDRCFSGAMRRDWINRQRQSREEDMPGPRTLLGGMEFMQTNADQDNWFLQIECFDPHEPFTAPGKYLELYDCSAFKDRPLYDWEHYGEVGETPPEDVQQLRIRYAALLSMCDHYLGKILDKMDELDLWKDTMLIVNTDHGHLLGEHGFFAKNRMPWFEELSHTPLFLWDPRAGHAGEKRHSLVQNIDLAPTLLEYFGLQPTKDMLGKPLRETIAADQPVRNAGIFGVFGGQVNITDGRYVYMRASVNPEEAPLNMYTLLPNNLRNCWINQNAYPPMELDNSFSFAKNLPVWKINQKGRGAGLNKWGTRLYDLQADPRQEHQIQDPDVERRMCELLVKIMKENEAPPEQFRRLGLEE